MDDSLFLILKKIKSKDFRKIMGKDNCEIDNINEGVYKVIVKLKDKNIFLKDTYNVIYESHLIVGDSKKFMFDNKILLINKISTDFNTLRRIRWFMPKVKYALYNLEYMEEMDNGKIYKYYKGYLGYIESNSLMQIFTMVNESYNDDLINPVRIEILSNNVFKMVMGYEYQTKDFLGEFIYDSFTRKLCNINSSDSSRYKVINMYQFTQIDY